MKAFYALVLCCAALRGQPGPLAERDPRYTLQPEDKVEAQYRYTPEYNGIASVQPDGYVSLPYVGEIRVAGLTLQQAADSVRSKAAETLNEPEVILLLKEYVKPFFVTAGEVMRPGRVEMHGPVTLVEAIALSGGFKDSARRTQVVLVRKPSGGLAEVRVFDVRKMMSARGIHEDVLIRPGDILVAPRNTISKIEPYVRLSEAGLYGFVQRLL